MTALPHINATQAKVIRSAVNLAAAFIQKHERRLRRDKSAGHDAERLAQTLVFHALQRTLALVWKDDTQRELAGVAIAFQTNADHVDACEVAHRSVFEWQPTDPAGDCIYLALVITDQPHAMPVLAQYYLSRFPDWERLPAVAHRRNKLVKATGLLRRLANFGQTTPTT